MFVSLPVPETSPVPNPRLFPSPLILFLQNLARKYIIWAPSEQFAPKAILVAKSKSGGRCHQNKVFFLLGGEYRPPFVLRKSRTSLRKSTSPPVSNLDMRLLSCSSIRVKRSFTSFIFCLNSCVIPI